MIEDGWNERRRLAGDFGARLDLLPQTNVLHLDGTRTFDRRSARSAMEAVSQPEGDLNLLPLVRRIGIGSQRVYCIWNHAQLLFQRDPALFGQIVNAFLGIAAELEHVSPDPVVLQADLHWRFIADGGCPSAVRGPFGCWDTDIGHTPFWEVASVVERPPVMICKSCSLGRSDNGLRTFV